jgi:5-methylcytosine-specific restriction protein B
MEMMPRPELLSEFEFAIDDLDLNSMLATINRRIERLLDRDHQIGHAYFMGVAKEDDPIGGLKLIFRDRVIPLLKEYFYNDAAKIGLVLGNSFVEIVKDDFAFARFDDDAASRYEDKCEYRFTDYLDWDTAAFKSIYENQED